MKYLFSAILGLVQGLAEFLPISSSGHLLLAEKLLAPLGYQGGDSALALIVMLHVGTLLAVLVYFFHDFWDMLRHPIKNKTLLYLFIASLPALAAKVLMGKWLDGLFTGWFLGVSFLVTALFLCIAEAVSRGRHGKKQEVDAPRALAIGGFQAIALLPGVSRSGATLLGGLVTGLDREKAARFSFMMSAPAILASFLVEAKDAIEQGALRALFAPEVLLGVAVAAISGYLAIRFMLSLIKRVSLCRFALYVAVVGVFVIYCQLTGTLGFPPIG